MRVQNHFDVIIHYFMADVSFEMKSDTSPENERKASPEDEGNARSKDESNASPEDERDLTLRFALMHLLKRTIYQEYMVVFPC